MKKIRYAFNYVDGTSRSVISEKVLDLLSLRLIVLGEEGHRIFINMENVLDVIESEFNSEEKEN